MGIGKLCIVVFEKKIIIIGIPRDSSFKYTMPGGLLKGAITPEGRPKAILTF